MPRMMFLNLPVRDIAAATRFYEAIGCQRNAQFSDENASSMVWSEAISFHLLTHAYFETYVRKPIADAQASTGMLIALSCDSRAAVDAMIDAAAAAGGRADIREPQDMGFMYLRTFEDPDGHVFEAVWLDMSRMPAAGG